METFRYYQREADEAIYNELYTKKNDRCLVKMFCGTGKSLLMRYGKAFQNHKLCVYVMPSLPLIAQFNNDYLKDIPDKNKLLISSDDENSTTNSKIITKFLKKKCNKIIIVTYQSFTTLINNLNNTKIDMCCYDEAHHAIGETYQQLIFDDQDENIKNHVFFTATPKNANNIIMCDNNDESKNMCGKLVYDYSYFKGATEGYLNYFDINIDLFTENTNKSIYESIARNILATGNNRVLTFHSDVNTKRDTSVKNFVNEKKFIETFNHVLETEFEELEDKYKSIKMIALDASCKREKRTEILDIFDKTDNNDIMIISSCETIGEGIDTKNANSCVFVDSKTSHVKITQNIGRIVRKIFGKDKPKSSILIPCWVDKKKYINAKDDKEKCDAVIREDMSQGGNFTPIFNVMSAIKQEDKDLYDACLNYSDYLPQEIKGNLKSQGYELNKIVGDGKLIETLKYVFDDNDLLENKQLKNDNKKILKDIAKDKNCCIEVHTNLIKNPINYYNKKANNIIRLFKNKDDTYQLILKIKNKKKIYNKNSLSNELKVPTHKPQINIHSNPDVKVLWKIVGNITDSVMNNCIIDCEVIDVWEQKYEILNKYCENEKNKFPSESIIIDGENIGTWINTQRTNKKKGKIFENRIKKLEQIRGWFWNKNLDEEWNDNYDMIKNYYKKNKKYPIDDCVIDDINIGAWIKTQKYNYHKNILKEDRKKRLETLEKWTWKDDEDETWENNYKILKNYCEKHNKCPAKLCVVKDIDYYDDNTNDTNVKHTNIGNWVDTQRQNYKKENLLKERINKLEKIHVWYWSYDQIWNDNYNFVKKYISENNNEYPKGGIVFKNNKMDVWLKKQRQNYKNNVKILDEERISKLESLNGWYWNIHNAKKKNTINNKSMDFNKSNSIKKIKVIDTDEENKIKVMSEISQLHKQYKTMTSKNLNKLFKSDKTIWENYHEISEENEKSFPKDEIPRNKIIYELDKIKTKRTKIVVDMGCGKAQIAQHFKKDKRFEFINYDHISCNKTVEECDISDVPLGDDEAEIAILSLAMWGSNCHSYIDEAFRILESGGRLYIIEATKRWTTMVDNQKDVKEADRLRQILKDKGFKIQNKTIGKFCLFECVNNK
jgi:superfamily II DNA or RNA helicase